ncbi:DUF1731 domain-containing protein [Oceanospirillaceae bacterium ASx5O]|nr:DUF1731 domain-containing protein [Oceanospirillaceae bacterium ASx5O]
MSYQAPLREMQFVLYELLKGDEILPSLPGFEDATREIMDAMLTEGAKLAQNVIAPTNVPGDREGCVYDPVAKTVKTPTGFKEAYQQFAEAGWTALSAPVEYGGQGLPFSLGLGGVIGDGEQVLSWIHADDYCNAVDFLLQSDITGPVNMTAPHPASNRDFTKTLAQTLRRPALAPLPAFATKLLFGEMSELLLKGQRVLPLQLQEQGFEFAYPQLAPALQQLFSR